MDVPVSARHAALGLAMPRYDGAQTGDQLVGTLAGKDQGVNRQDPIGPFRRRPGSSTGDAHEQNCFDEHRAGYFSQAPAH